MLTFTHPGGRRPGRVARLLFLLLPVIGLGSVQAQNPEVSTDRRIYLPNEPVLARFQGGPGNLRDWVGLYTENAAGGNYLFWQYLDGSQTGVAPLSDGETLFVKGPSQEGTYELRMYENDGYSELASIPFEVRKVARLLQVPRRLLPATPFAIAFTNGPGQATDWVGLFPVQPANAAPVSRWFVDGTETGNAGRSSGTLSFVAPSASGTYEARFMEGATGTTLDAVRLEVGYPGPVVDAVGADGVITLRWQAPAWPMAIEGYIVLTRPPGASDWESLGSLGAGDGEQVFRHAGRPPGEERCYAVRAEGSGGASAVSAPVCATAMSLGAGQRVALGVPPGTVGNQAWDGALGIEFEVVNPIRITRLGVFDDGSDGLKRTLTARLYDRTTRVALATLEFAPNAPGVLMGGSRFKDLPTPVDLKTGFKGTIVAEGYGPGEAAGNRGLKPFALTASDGDGAVVLVGKGRYGPAGLHPATVDAGPAQRYAAGTFQFQVTAVTSPGKPVLASIPDDGAVLLSWPAVTQPIPAARYKIFRSNSASGTFAEIAEIGGADTAYRDGGRPNGTESCYRIRAVAEGGGAGPDSETECQVPNVVQGGIAYLHPFELEGNQAIDVAVGNDFDVTRPIRITRLGAFDDGSDGLRRTLSVRLYERPTQRELARLTFTPDQPGTLVGGTRFLDLAAPVDLPIGFQGTIVASGYGTEERVGNEGLPGTADLNLGRFTGGCLRFVGTSRYGESPDGFPPIADGGPMDRYAAGTFAFEPLPLPVSSPRILLRRAEGVLEMTWEGPATLEGAASVTGPWEPSTGAVSGIRVAPGDRQRFFRLRAGP